jgi:hypothetical protein
MVNVLEKLRTEAEKEVEEVTTTNPKDMKYKNPIYRTILNTVGKTTTKQSQEAREQDENNAKKRENKIDNLVKNNFLKQYEHRTIKINFLNDPRVNKEYDENDSEFYQIYDNKVEYLGKIRNYEKKDFDHNKKFNSPYNYKDTVYTLTFDNDEINYDQELQNVPHILMLNSTNTEGTEGGSKRHKSTRKQTSKKKKKSRKSNKKSRKSRRKPNRSRR